MGNRIDICFLAHRDSCPRLGCWSRKYPLRLTATTMRIRVSILYAGIEMSETNRQLFYKHMDHNSAISQNVYQTPGAEAEILKVGYNLVAMDDKNNRHCSISSVEATV